MTDINLAAIRARDAECSTVAIDTDMGMQQAFHALLDRRTLLTHIAALEAAARDMDCYWCRGTGTFLGTERDCGGCAHTRIPSCPPMAATSAPAALDPDMVYFRQAHGDDTIGRTPDSAPAVAPAPLNVDGIILADGRAMLVGTATWDRDTGKYRCLANVEGALCMVEIKVTPHAAGSAPADHVYAADERAFRAGMKDSADVVPIPEHEDDDNA